MSMQVSPSIAVLRWAAERTHLSEVALAHRFPKWPQWREGEAQPTLKQLEAFARFTHTPFGYFFLLEPPQIALPVPDFRTHRDTPLAAPSTDLLDTLYLSQQRQEWFREYAQWHGLTVMDWVGSGNIQGSPEDAAEHLREVLALSIAERQRLPTWTEALRQLISKSEDAGVLVMGSSVVGTNSHRKLDVEEFRGFALSDDLAPLIFLNAADSKSAQMFTLAHELAHLLLGKSGVSDTQAGRVPDLAIERWCNRVAAELLMPLDETRRAINHDTSIEGEIRRLARKFKVSTLVALRRLFDANQIDEPTLWQLYHSEVERLQTIERASGGGDFYRTLSARTGKRFARALVASALEGQTLFQDAFRLLGLRKSETFYAAARELGVMA